MQLRTADGQDIYHGMRVWDYDLEAATVDLTRQTSSLGDDGWFDVKTDAGRVKPMNGVRVVVFHPHTRERA